MKRTALLVSGSRHWTDYDVIDKRLALYPLGTILIHGACGSIRKNPDGTAMRDECNRPVFRGADLIAATLSKRHGFIQHPLPYFDDLGKQGGPVRNACMFGALLNLARFDFDCHFEAFPLDGPGTAGMIRIVEKHNVYADPLQIPIHVTRG